MQVDPATAGLMLGTATAVPSIMGAFTDKPADVAGETDPQRLAELRRGELIGAAWVIGLALLLASTLDRKHSGLVLATATATAALMLYEHERAIRIIP